MWVPLKRAGCCVSVFGSVKCACVPQLSQQLINTMLYPLLVYPAFLSWYLHKSHFTYDKHCHMTATYLQFRHDVSFSITGRLFILLNNFRSSFSLFYRLQNKKTDNMDDWKLNAHTLVRLKREHRTFVFLFIYTFTHLRIVDVDITMTFS